MSNVLSYRGYYATVEFDSEEGLLCGSVVGMSDVLNEQSSTPAMAASAEPMAKVAEMVALTLMPMSCAAALSSEQARMALPILLLLTKVVSASMMTTQTAMVRSEM